MARSDEKRTGRLADDTQLERREALLMEIACAWRSDWSGRSFDGDDGHRWIDTALHGSMADLDQLAKELADLAESF